MNSTRAGAATRGHKLLPDTARALVEALRREVRGEVRFGAGDRALYANDASVYRQVPIGVVIPKSIDDVVASVAICREHDAPLFARGCGTGLAGQSVNAAVLIDFSKYMNHVLELDHEGRCAVVEPGVILDTLREQAEQHHLTFGPDPATHTRCTLGGMIGNNSCGVHSIMSGVTADNIGSLDVLLYDGTRLTLPCATSPEERETIIRAGGRRGDIYARLAALAERYGDLVRERFPKIPRRISGYNLDRLLPEHHFNLAAALVGTEGTCAVTLRARCKLIPSPQCRVLVMIGYEDGYVAADHAAALSGYGPIGLEMFDRRLVQNELEKGFQRHTELLPEGDGWLLVEFGASSQEEAREQAQRLMDGIKGGDHRGLKCYAEPDQQKEIWNLREGGVGHSKIPGEHPGWPSFEDAAVAPEKIGPFLRDFEKLVNAHGRRIAALFGHVGHGCVHTRIDWDLRDAQGIANYRRTMQDAADLVARYGGSLSGEHGDGQARAELLDRMFGPELIGAFREFKAIWDPDGRMNPGKMSDPYPLDTNLRMPLAQRIPPVRTHFRLPDDGGSFAMATQRCFGVGKCRRLGGEGTMCPSFMATREERYSTRGRARLLFEMLNGDVIKDGWRSEAVKDALDLCLACKGCKHDCPVRVDMASYKAEFLSHYYRRRLRPIPAYLFGLIPWGARMAALTPGLANKLIRTRAFKRVSGIAPQRELPGLAEHTFKQAFHRRAHPQRHGRRVILWPDTFTNFFEPEVGMAAVDVLEAVGCKVVLPRGALCCGRPLYDYGMLDLARHKLRQILVRLRADIRAGVPVIGLEPSCTAVFRDELVNLFPDDEDAQRLARQTFTFAEFVTGHNDFQLPRLGGRAIVHAHCHHKSIMQTGDLCALLEQLGIDYRMPDSGCCGMAGGFGYEAGAHYDVSLAAGERVLLPAVRAAPKDTLIIADGFSCRTQIAALSDRRALHPAQVVQMALCDARLAARDYPESGRFASRPTRLGRRDKLALGTAGAVVLGAVAAWAITRRHRS